MNFLGLYMHLREQNRRSGYTTDDYKENGARRRKKEDGL